MGPNKFRQTAFDKAKMGEETYEGDPHCNSISCILLSYMHY